MQGKIHHGGTEDTEKDWAKNKVSRGLARITRISLGQE
jgi:hypothetical protein